MNRRTPPQPPGLDLTSRMRELCGLLCASLDELRHVQMDRVALRICQVRRGGPFGVQATMTPLRFPGGATTTIRRGRPWVIRPVPRDSAAREFLYLMSLYVPRFLDLPAPEKVAVTIHELWHISPAFDGDLRRFPGRYHAHGGSCENYHCDMRKLAERWLADRPTPDAYDFLEGDFRAMQTRYGRVFGLRYPTPRLWRADTLPKSTDAA